MKRRIEREHYYNGYLHEDGVKDEVTRLLKDNADYIIDKACMHHLTRRLNTTQDDNSCQNLHSQLTTESALCLFLNSYGYHFENGANGLDIIKSGKRVAFDIYDPRSARLRVRLGNCTGVYRDYCVNGFAFADRIEKNSYFQNLSSAPEFIQDIATFFNDRQMIQGYFA